MTEFEYKGVKYSLIVRQEPQRARMCGFNDYKDRRFLDPPLILELKPVESVVSPDDTHGLIVQVSLWSDDGKREKMLVTSTRQIAYIDGMGKDLVPSPELSGSSLFQTRSPINSFLGAISGDGEDGTEKLYETLTGTVVANGHYYKDVGGDRDGLFFIFHDLSVRVQGTFRLKCQLFDVFAGVDSACLCAIFSGIFEVFSPKGFPGMSVCTPISEHFAKLGAPIHVRREFATLPQTPNIPLSVTSENLLDELSPE